MRVKAYTGSGGPGNGFSRRAGMRRLMRFWRVQVTRTASLLEAFDWTEMIIAYLEESFSAYDDRRHEIRSFERAQAAIAGSASGNIWRLSSD
jgi:hypothetical protein